MQSLTNVLRLAVLLTVLIAPVAPALGSTIIGLNLDLTAPDDASTPGFNTFLTTFAISLGGVQLADSTETVFYTDEPTKTGLRTEMEIDFSNPAAPVVETITFLGELGDIDHSLESPPVEIVDPGVPSLFNIQAAAAGVGSFLRTNDDTGGSPIRVPVAPNGSYSSSDTTLNVVEGTITATGTLLGSAIPPQVFELSEDNEDLGNPISNNTDSSVMVILAQSTPTLNTYDVTVEAPVEDALIQFVDDDTGAVVDFVINGALRGTGSFTVAVPEPSAGLLAVATLLPGLLTGASRRFRTHEGQA